MKNVLLGISMTIMGFLLIFALISYSGNTTRQNDIDNALQAAVEDTVAQVKKENITYNIATNDGQEEFVAMLLENLSLAVSNDSEIKVDILAADADKGLLKVKATETYTTTRGNKLTYTAVETALLEQNYRIRENYTAYFYIKLNDDPTTRLNESTLSYTDTNITRYPKMLYKSVTQMNGDILSYPTIAPPDWTSSDGKKHTFAGWSTSQLGDTVTVFSGGSSATKMTKDMKFYAVYN